jgi:aspartate aminotransferase
MVFTGYFDAPIVPIPTKAEEGFHYADQEKIEKLITPRTKAIIVNTPTNPTGNVLTAEEMKMILALAKKHDLYVIADEVYREFVYDGEPLSSFGQHMKGYEDNLIIVDSISKRFSACGARIGEILTKNKEVQGSVMKLAQGRLSAPTLEQKGAVALYSLEADYFDEVREEYQRRRDVAIEEINKIEGAVCQKPKGSFYITIKLPVDSAEDFLVFMLKEFADNGETIMFAPVEGFYTTAGMGKNEIRIAYVLNEKEIRRGMELLKLGLIAYKNRQ